jgi:hypothetical protein
MYRENMKAKDGTIDHGLFKADPVHPPGDQSVPWKIPGRRQPGIFIHPEEHLATKKEFMVIKMLRPDSVVGIQNAVMASMPFFLMISRPWSMSSTLNIMTTLSSISISVE